MQKSFHDEAIFELHFWLQILGDHSRFIHDALAVSETQNIQKAHSFIQLFDSLVNDSRNTLSNEALLSLLNKAGKASEEIRAFKLHLIEQHLVGDIKISLPPTFINHMVNEVEEAIRLFSFMETGQSSPQVHPLHHDLLWLLDAAGHAGAIHDNLDAVEMKWRKKSRQFTKDWEAFYLKAIELASYLRTNVLKFPALAKFHKDIHLELAIFQTFLQELEDMRLSKEALGTLAPLMADHMAREECYYLTKLAETTAIPAPACNPAKPRLQE